MGTAPGKGEGGFGYKCAKKNNFDIFILIGYHVMLSFKFIHRKTSVEAKGWGVRRSGWGQGQG